MAGEYYTKRSPALCGRVTTKASSVGPTLNPRHTRQFAAKELARKLGAAIEIAKHWNSGVLMETAPNQTTRS